MPEDSLSLTNLHDLVEPAAVPSWPLAPGWWLLIGAAFLILAVWLWKCWRRFLRNAYRREALGLLASAETVAEVAVLLKRCVRVWMPAQALTGLTEADWLSLLSRSGKVSLPPEIRENWSDAVYRPQNSGDLATWKSFAGEWIRSHQPEGSGD